MSIATRRGDQGETDLLFGHRITKKHPRIHALGDVDELNAALGLLRVHAQKPLTLEVCAQTQRWLIDLMGEVATPPGLERRYTETHPHTLGVAEVEWLDAKVQYLEDHGALKFEGWALPGAGGSISGAHADMARTICRRAERTLIDLSGTAQAIPNMEITRFLNRLSDVLWLLARWEEIKPADPSAAQP
jgi:cob(I)alamin adenosyltransferase